MFSYHALGRPTVLMSDSASDASLFFYMSPSRDGGGGVRGLVLVAYGMMGTLSRRPIAEVCGDSFYAVLVLRCSTD